MTIKYITYSIIQKRKKNLIRIIMDQIKGRYLTNNLFRIIFFIEIIFGIMVIFKLPMNKMILIILFSIIYISGIYAVRKFIVLFRKFNFNETNFNFYYRNRFLGKNYFIYQLFA